MSYEVKLYINSYRSIHIMIYNTILKFTNSLIFYVKDGVYLTRYVYCKKEIVNHLVTLGYITIVEMHQATFVKDKTFANYILKLTPKTLLEVL